LRERHFIPKLTKNITYPFYKTRKPPLGGFLALL